MRHNVLPELAAAVAAFSHAEISGILYSPKGPAMYTRRFWVDTETTGLDSRKHFAFQISYFIEENNRILAERTLEMCPANYEHFVFDKEAEAVHGYSKERIQSLPAESEQYKILIGDLQQFAQDRLTLTGYNIQFDLYFLQALFNRNKPAGRKTSFFYEYFDYMPCDIMQFVQGCRIAGTLDLPGISLEKVCGHLGICVDGAHNSMTDIVNTKAVFDTLVGRKA
jgi:DNA polymerase III epsilon subunit-like protein